MSGGIVVDMLLRFLFVPADLESWLIVVYVAVVLAAARLFEMLARGHFERARQHFERGFQYDADGDHYHCPEGERLSLHLRDEPRRLAVYRAPAARCNDCALKASCTPHEQGRHVYRSLATWAETDVGRFHRRLSLLMFAVGATLSAASLCRGWGQAGAGCLMLTLGMSLASLVRELKEGTQGAFKNQFPD